LKINSGMKFLKRFTNSRLIWLKKINFKIIKQLLKTLCLRDFWLWKDKLQVWIKTLKTN
jgi:hypothetical protein